jgi:NitT/TauT family transport system substrate-binding protein
MRQLSDAARSPCPFILEKATMTTARRWIRIACMLMALGAGPALAEQEVKLVLDWTWQANHAFFTLAEDNGYFANEGLKVRIDRGFGSGDTIGKVAVGTYEFGFADPNLLVNFNAKNPDKKVICVMMLMDGALNAIVTKTSSGIHTLKDLEGRKLAAPAADNSRLLFPIVARANGVDESRIQWLSVQPNVRDAMLARGETDAVASLYTSSVLALAEMGVPRTDLTVLRYSDLGADLYGFGIVVSEKFLTENPGLVRGFLRAVTRGTRDALANPKAGLASLRKRDPIMNDTTEMTRMEILRTQSVLTPAVKANGLSYVDPIRLERTIGFVAQSMGISTPPAARDVFRGDFLPTPAERRMPE